MGETIAIFHWNCLEPIITHSMTSYLLAGCLVVTLIIIPCLGNPIAERCRRDKMRCTKIMNFSDIASVYYNVENEGISSQTQMTPGYLGHTHYLTPNWWRQTGQKPWSWYLILERYNLCQHNWHFSPLAFLSNEIPIFFMWWNKCM